VPDTGFTVFLFRVVRLGSKIMPLVRVDDKTRARLSKFSATGTVLVMLQLGSMLLAFVFMVIICPIFPGVALYSRVSMAMLASFLLCCGTGLVLQLQRCIQVIQQIQFSSRNLDMNNGASGQASYQKVINKMRWNQALEAVIALPIVLVFYCLAFQAMPTRWFYVVCIAFGGEALGAFLVEVINKMNTQKPSRAASSANPVQNRDGPRAQSTPSATRDIATAQQ
jgi:hypothetical protein